MPDENEHEKIEDMVEVPGEAAKSARSLEQAANSNQTLQGFQAVNNERIPEDLENEGLEPPKKK
jgi:hypothetical protein